MTSSWQRLCKRFWPTIQRWHNHMQLRLRNAADTICILLSQLAHTNTFWAICSLLACRGLRAFLTSFKSDQGYGLQQAGSTS
eukprot:scaffold133668_cov21-Prasinocladus_malaysianus.AAC.1